MSIFGEARDSIKRNLLPTFVWMILVPVLAIGIVTGGAFAVSGAFPSASSAAPRVSMADQGTAIIRNLACLASDCTDRINAKSYLLTALATRITVTDAAGVAKFTPAHLDAAGWKNLYVALSQDGRITGADLQSSKASSPVELTATQNTTLGALSGSYSFSTDVMPILQSATFRQGSTE